MYVEREEKREKRERERERERWDINTVRERSR